MNCPHPMLLEDYAQRLLSGPKAADIESHLASCQTCRRELEERRRWLEAFGSLRSLELPDGFARRVTEAAFSASRGKGRRFSFPALQAALVSLALTSVVLAVAGVCGLPQMMTRSGNLLWRGFQAGISFWAKALRWTLTVLKFASRLLQSLWEIGEILGRATFPYSQILALISLMLLTAAFVFGYRKLFVRR